MTNGKVYEFKTKAETALEEKQQSAIDGFMRYYLDEFELEKDDLIDIENVKDKIAKLILEDNELVFNEPSTASMFAKIILEMEGFEEVSHFEIVLCASRLSSFYKLVAVRKSDVQYIFPDATLLHSAFANGYAENLKNMVKDEEEVKNNK